MLYQLSYVHMVPPLEARTYYPPRPAGTRWPPTCRFSRAFGQIRTDGLFRTEEALCRWSYEGIVPGAGFEPTLPRPKRGVLPLNDPGSKSPLLASNQPPAAYKAALYPSLS
jgi:hypothetical protein